MRLHWFVSSPNRRFGALRKLLPGWARSPLRRLVQAGAFAAFFLLVFWQLRPVPPDGTSSFQLPPQVFLWLDPLANASAAVAARTFTASLLVAGGILLLSIALPRMFCGYICPLGTLIDLSDWLVTGRFRRLHVSATGGSQT